MKDLFVLVAHLLSTLIKLMRPGGVRSVRSVGALEAATPHYLSSDNDPLFLYHRWRANLRVLDINEIKSVPYTPTSHPFVERLIGTVRREFLDQTLFWSRTDLQRKLDSFKWYYNDARVHSSLKTQTPTEKSSETRQTFADLKNFNRQLHCDGLFQTPVFA